jgi:hypothetical protein
MDVRALTASLAVVGLSVLGAQSDRNAVWSTIHGTPLFASLGSNFADDLLPRSLSVLPAEVRTEYERRLSRRNAYKPRTPKPPAGAGFEFQSIGDHRRTLETAIVVLLESPDLSDAGKSALEQEAGRYASAAILAYEWEGFPDGPLAEAAHAAKYLREHPTTLIRPYLDLFLLHRYRCGFEAAGFEVFEYPYQGQTASEAERIRSGYLKNQREAAGAYVAAWKQLEVTKDSVVRAIADEIDGVRDVYIATNLHPRTFIIGR